MSWAVGEDPTRRRHIGYGVPATCDHPDCGQEIDRGIAYACGDGVMGELENCGLFFCEDHLSHFVESTEGGGWVCERCANNEPPFEPSPDTTQWATHVLTDASWAEFRAQEPDWTAQYRVLVTADHMREHHRPKEKP